MPGPYSDMSSSKPGAVMICQHQSDASEPCDHGPHVAAEDAARPTAQETR